MDELSAKEKLFQLWMIYSSKTDPKALQEYIQLFTDSYKDLVDFDFNHLKDGFSEEGPHLTFLPESILQTLANQLHQCCFTDDLSTVQAASDILKCLIVLCRNHDNVPLVASCEFVSYIVKLASDVVEKIRNNLQSEMLETYIVFLKLTLHFFECLYDPYFIWRKKLLGWTVGSTAQKFKPALLHVEVIPFFHDCFQKKGLPLDMKVRLIHMFGAMMSGSQANALIAITPATLDVLLRILSSNEHDRPTNEQRQEMLALKDLVLKSTVRMVHVIHCCSPDQRQVEVGQIMEGYMQVLLDKDAEPENEADMKMQLTMIGAINEMLLCQDKSALQVILVSGGTFDSFISLLQNTSLCGPEAQKLAMSVLTVMSTVLGGSCNAKERFKLRVGYGRFVEVLKRLGQPSIELLKSVLNLVVEAVFEEKKAYAVHNTQAAIMLIQWLPDIHSHDLQIWLAENLRALCSFQHKNKMNCCNDGMIGAILTVLGREKQINSTAVSHLIGLLESLGTLSITAIELKQLIGLLRLDEEENQNKYCSRLMRAMSTMARREGKDGALHFFNFQEQTDGIALPGIRKWGGPAFAFHSWICLDNYVDTAWHDLQKDQPYRRQIYSFMSSSGSGFEAFLTHNGSIVVAVHSKKDYYTAVVENPDILDSNWHSLVIMHSNSKRPFTNSYLYVYVDGKEKLNTQLKFPNLSDPLTSCRVGSPQPHSHLEALFTGTVPVFQETKKPSPLRSVLKHVTKNHSTQSDMESIAWGTQEQVWGPALSLHGQVGCVCFLNDLLSEAQVAGLYRAGPNNLTLMGVPDAADMLNKLLLRYNAKGCKETHCIDLTNNQNHGQLIGQKCVTWDIKDVVNCIGGIQVLFPLLEQVNNIPIPRDILSPDVPMIENLNKTVEHGDWLVLPSSSYADTKLEQNQVAGFLTLLRNMVQTKPTNQDSFVRTNSAAIIGALLQKVNKKLIDVHVLMAAQLLVEATAPVSKVMLNHLYQYVLFDFRIWSRSDFPVRIGHIQYLSTIIKDDKRHFRKTFGVQYMLDVIKSYYSSDCGLSEEDAKVIRLSLLNLIKFYIFKEITVEELNSLLNFMIACKEENMICEVLDLLILLLEKDTVKQDQLFLRMFEPEMGELLYGLLTDKGYTIVFYEKVVKLLYRLLTTERVYEKSKTRLRLADCGYLGLVGLMEGCEVSGPTIKRFIEQVSVTDTPASYNAVLAILQLIYTSGFDIKLEASRQLQSILVSKPGAVKSFAKQLGWQEAITKLFVLRPLPNICDTGTVSNDDIIMIDNDSDFLNHSEEHLKGSNSEGLNPPGGENSISESKVINNHEVVQNISSEDELYLHAGGDNPDSLKQPWPRPRADSERSLLSDIKSNLKPDARFILDLEKAVHFTDHSQTPESPLYIKRQTMDLLEDEEDSQSMSRSSSVSAEDLSAIAQHRAHQMHRSEDSNATLTHSDSDINFDTPEVVTRRESLPSSYINYTESMKESLGLRGSFLMELVGDSEELCQNLLMVLLTIMWKGVEGSDKTAWQERGQVFSWFNHISETNELIRPVKELKRCLLEMLVHSCMSEIRDAGHSSQTYMENALELVRIVRLFVTEKASEMDIFSERLMDDIMCLLDSLAVWDVQSGAGWQEMVHLGLSILASFAKHDSLNLCAAAAAQLHRLIQTKLISSSAEASFLIGHLNDVIIKAVKEKADNYSYTIPVLKALIEKAEPLLTLDLNLPNLPSTSMSPTFFDDFKTYCLDEEWTIFIDNYVTPQRLHFEEIVFAEMSKTTHEFWEDCQEQMKVNFHKRNRERGESKLKFQNQILEVYQTKLSHEERRFHNITTQVKNQHHSALRQWRATKRFFTGERGAWAERETVLLHWKLSNQENFSRMKVKMIQNYTFDSHQEASLLRDNQGSSDTDAMQQLEHLKIAKEALVSKENIADDAIGDEEWNVISSSSTNITIEYQDKEKLILAEECELVTLVEVIKGRLEVTNTHVYFFDCSSLRDEGGEDFKWSLSQLREIHFRRYNLRRSALEMFLIDQTNYFLNFEKKVRNKVYSRILSLRPPNLIYYGSRSPAELLKASNLVQKWVQRDISNFEYLMQLNTIAGRTYNDLSQYPVFPWILSDYTCSVLDLDNPEVFRDLSKPVGVLNPKNEDEVREKYENFEDPSGVIGKFHYGTHYSNSAGVMHYMIRMEPFTTLHIALHSDRFDIADRQFHSIPGTWNSMYNNPSDVKELIPEFFYLPEFLVNSNGFDLGRLQLSKIPVNDVVLPAWAATPEDFIYKHRKALESEYVSSNLHNWIDLIFGYKQKGQAAADALNVFYYCTYEGAVDLDAVEDPKERASIEGMINNFGQTPCQLLKDPHPRRMTFDEVVAKSLRTERRMSLFYFLDQLKVYYVEVSQDTDPLAYICVPRNQQRSIIQHGMPDTMVTVSEKGILGTHGWLPYDKSISNYFTFERDPSVSNPKTRKKYSCHFAPGLKIDPKLFVVSHDAKLIFSGGHWDNSLQVVSISRAKKINHIVRHINIVTCLALDYCGSHLITGSRDTTCMIWQVIQQSGVSTELAQKPIQTLYGHDNEVTAVHISIELDMAVSASKDGSVIIHTVRKGHYMRTLRPPNHPSYVMNIPMLAVDDTGHIIVYCQETFPIDPKEILSLHVYSLNGKKICSSKLQHQLSHMIVKGDCLITGDTHGSVSVLEIFGLKTMTTLPLHEPITCLALTNGNSHLFAGLRDGKLIIIGIKNRSELK